MHIYRFRSLAEYLAHQEKHRETLELRVTQLANLEKQNQSESFTVKGFSITAEDTVNFRVDRNRLDNLHINWRETLICPVTGLNNRMRAGYHLYLSEMQPYQSDSVYISEQVTPLYSFLSQKIDNLIGSEYVDQDIASGEVTETNIRHEDLTNLSFPDNSLDKILSFDCLEHIPNYEKVIAECSRVLKSDGSMLMSFPFDSSRQDTLTRAAILPDGSIEHYCEPEYHGDPFSEQGCLSYYVFGWDILDLFRTAGFSSVYAVVCWSDIFGYLGGQQIAFIAKK